MVQKLVLRDEVIKVKGRVKVIMVKKEDFFKVLKLTKLRILDKEYEALMPPLDGLQKNTIDVNGLAVLYPQFIDEYFSNSGNTNPTTPAQMILITQGGNITLSYSGSVGLNSQGVTVYLQVLQENNNWTFQYYYVGFDTTSDSYTTSQIELYASAYVQGSNKVFYTNTVRIAYANISFTKAPDSYLFIVWLIAFQDIPTYLVFFTPTLQNNVGIMIQDTALGTGARVYFNNGNCNFSCGGNCPSTVFPSILVYVQNNSFIVEIPITAPLGAGVSNLEILLCDWTQFNGLPTISGNVSATLTPPVSGATFYVAIATITITFQAS